MSAVLYPDIDDLLAEIDVLCERAGFHVRDAGALASALARPMTNIFGQEQYPGLLTKAAVLLDSISRSHPLLDGNKRLAWEVAKMICELNGWTLQAPPTQIDEFVRAVAGDEHMPLEDITAWLEAHAVTTAQHAYDTDPRLRDMLTRAAASPSTGRKPERR